MTNEELEKFGLKPGATDEEICIHNPDVVLPALNHPDDGGRYYAFKCNFLKDIIITTRISEIK